MDTVNKKYNFDIEGHIAKACDSASKSDIIAFCIALFLGFCIHGAALTDFFINEDSLLSGYMDVSPLGRFLFGPLYHLTESMPMQFLHTSIFVLLTSLSGIIIAKLLSAESTVLKIIIATSYIAYPAFAIGLTYNFSILGYACASAFAIFSVYYANKDGVVSFCAAVLLLAASLGLYQAYLPVAAGLCAAILLQFALSNDMAEKPQLILFAKKSGKLIGYGLVSGVVYLICIKISAKIMGTQLAEYQGADKIGTLDLSSVAFNKIYHCYANLLNGTYFPFPSFFKYTVAVIALLGIISIFKKQLVYPSAKHKAINTAAAFCLVLLLLVVAILMPIIAPFAEISFMQTYGIVIVVAVGLTLAADLCAASKSISIIAAVLMVACFTTRTNAQYYQSSLITQGSLHSVSRIFSRIEQVDGFSCDKKLAVIGTLPNAYLHSKRQAPFMTEPNPAYSGNFVGLSRANQSHKFTKILSFLGYEMTPIRDAAEVLVASRVAMNMPAYPRKGSVVATEGMVVVKFSDPLLPLHKESQGNGRYVFRFTPFDQSGDLEFAWQVLPQGGKRQVIQTPQPELSIVLPDAGRTYCVIGHYRKKGTNSFVNSKPSWFIAN